MFYKRVPGVGFEYDGTNTYLTKGAFDANFETDLDTKYPSNI